MPVSVLATIATSMVRGIVPGGWIAEAMTAGLASTVKREIVRQFMPSIVRAALPGADLLKIMMRYGLGIRRTDFYGILREIRNSIELPKKEGTYRVTHRESSPTDFPFPHQYTARVEIFGRNRKGLFAHWTTWTSYTEGESINDILARAEENLLALEDTDTTLRATSIYKAELKGLFVRGK